MIQDIFSSSPSVQREPELNDLVSQLFGEGKWQIYLDQRKKLAGKTEEYVPMNLET